MWLCKKHYIARRAGCKGCTDAKKQNKFIFAKQSTLTEQIYVDGEDVYTANKFPDISEVEIDLFAKTLLSEKIKGEKIIKKIHLSKKQDTFNNGWLQGVDFAIKIIKECRGEDYD